MWKSKLLSALLLVAAVHLRASTVIPVDVVAQVDEADLIFVGTVLETKSVPVKDGSFAYTYVTFAVDETLKGSASGASLTLRVAGGQAGQYVYEIAGGPAVQEGGRHLLFVRGNDRRGIPLSGGPQGKLNLVSHPVTQEEIVVDEAGRVLDGIRDGNWVRSGMRLDAHGALQQPQAVATVISQEGVEVTLDQPETGDEAAPASQVIAELRDLIQSRAFAPKFQRGAAVDSASPDTVPSTQ